MLVALQVIAGYLAGSVPFGLLLARWRAGVDVRSQGSGNIGATNVARVAGKKLGVVVLLLDAAKGAAPVLASLLLMPGAPRVHAAVALAAFLGHVFPPWLGFRGGKGVATALGTLIVLLPGAALAGFCAYALVLALTRVSSLGSLLGGLSTATAALLSERPREYVVLAFLLYGLMLFTHRANIRRILRRAEKAL